MLSDLASEAIKNFVSNYNIIDYLVAGFFALLWSTVDAVNTQGEFSRIPWMKLIFACKSIEEIKRSFLYLVFLALWAFIGIATVTGLVFLVKDLSDISHANKKFSLFSVIVSLGIYDYFIRKAVNLTRKAHGKESQSKPIIDTKIIRETILNSNGEGYKPPLSHRTILAISLVVDYVSRSLIYMYPGIVLAPIYDKIYSQASWFKNVTELMISGEFNSGEVEKFYRNHNISEKIRNEIDKDLLRCKTDDARKGVIIRRKLDLVGYSRTLYCIRKYKYQKRKPRSAPKKNSIEMELATNTNVKCTLENISQDGEGICVFVKKCDDNQLYIGNSYVFLNRELGIRVEGEFVQSRINGEYVYCGFKVKNNKDELWRKIPT